MPNQPSTWSCDPVDNCISADIAKVQPGSDLKNTLILRRRIRVRLLDCRSGLPLVGQPIEEVKLNGQTIGKFLVHDTKWDISKHFPISGEGGKRKFGLKEVSETKASQIVLNALGYDCGAPSNAYGVQGKTAFLQFRVLAQGVNIDSKTLKQLSLFKVKKLGEKWLPSPGKSVLRNIKDSAGKEIEFKGPSSDEMDELIRLYNTKCYQVAQYHLASLGFHPPADPGLADGALDATDSGEWTDAWVEVFKHWQQVAFGYGEKDCFSWIKREKEGKRLMEQERGLVTDENGDLHVPIPLNLLSGDVTLEIGFKDFAVVAEDTKKEYEGTGAKLHRIAARKISDDNTVGKALLPKAGDTLFSIEWVDSQQEGDGARAWGWRCGQEPSKSANRASLREFRTVWKFTIPAFAKDELGDAKKGPNWRLLHRRTGALSMFYDADDTSPEFVLFALVWCQPVWDGIEDPSPGHHLNFMAYVDPDNGDRGRYMHIVTRAYGLAGSDKYPTKGYGKMEHVAVGSTHWRGGDGHAGYDMHAAVGDKVFAVHAGKVGQYHDDVGGNVCQVSWAGEGQTTISYLHLSEYKKENGDAVKAGEIVALAGRTGNLGETSDNPGHCHINVGASGYTSKLNNAPDDANRVCIPTNKTALLIPCACDIPKYSNITDCKFEDPQCVLKCWAVAELKCPHMWARTKTARRLQAQLRFLSESSDDESLDPGPLDGDLGAIPEFKPDPTKKIVLIPPKQISAARKAMRDFRLKHVLTKAQADALAESEGYGDFTDSEWNKLDELAPVEKPESKSG